MKVQSPPQLIEGLAEKRRNLAAWLNTASINERKICLGPAAEGAVQEHIHVIDEALQLAGSDSLGICKICGEQIEDRLLEMDFTAQVCLTHYTAEEARQLENDLELTQAIQRALLPHEPPDIPGLKLAAFSRPAQIISGDFFDFMQFQDGRMGIAIADAVGKGMPASLIMASAQTALRTLVPMSNSPAEVLYKVNRLFAHNIHLTAFVTMFLGAYDHASHSLTYSNAGHNPPLVYCQGNGSGREMRQLLPGGAAIGLVENSEFREEKIHLQPGDLALLYTDGVIEAFNDQHEQFDMSRLEEVLRQNTASSPKQLIRDLLDKLRVFTAGQPLADDVTIIACRRINEARSGG